MNPIRRYKEWVDKVVESVLPDIIEGEIKAVRENRRAKDSRIVANGSSDNEYDGENEHTDIRTSGTSDVMPTNECDHDWVHKSGAGYRSMPVAICIKCYAEKTYCPKCGEKL